MRDEWENGKGDITRFKYRYQKFRHLKSRIWKLVKKKKLGEKEKFTLICMEKFRLKIYRDICEDAERFMNEC